MTLSLGHAFGCETSLVEIGDQLVARPTEDWDGFPVEVVAHRMIGNLWVANTKGCAPEILAAAYRAIREAGGCCRMELAPYGCPVWEVPS